MELVTHDALKRKKNFCRVDASTSLGFYLDFAKAYRSFSHSLSRIKLSPLSADVSPVMNDIFSKDQKFILWKERKIKLGYIRWCLTICASNQIHVFFSSWHHVPFVLLRCHFHYVKESSFPRNGDETKSTFWAKVQNPLRFLWSFWSSEQVLRHNRIVKLQTVSATYMVCIRKCT